MKNTPVRTNTPDGSPPHGRTEPPSLVQQHMDYHYTSTPGTDDSFQDTTAEEEKEEEEEDFPTGLPDDGIWLEDPVSDRCLCIHEQSQPHFLCSYPCPYRLQDTQAPYYEMMDLIDISDFLDVMTTTNDEDIPDMDDVFEL